MSRVTATFTKDLVTVVDTGMDTEVDTGVDTGDMAINNPLSTSSPLKIMAKKERVKEARKDLRNI